MSQRPVLYLMPYAVWRIAGDRIEITELMDYIQDPHTYEPSPRDIATQELMFHTIEKICSLGKSVLVSTHDLGILTVHFSRVLFLDKTFIADGTAGNVLTPQNIAKAYGFEFHKNRENTPF